MSYFDKFTAQEAKLAELLNENHLLHTFKTDGYPITLTVQPNTTPEAQMALFETSKDGISSQDASLVFQFPVGEIGWRIHGRLIMSDSLMNKIKNHAKKMLTLWLQADFAARAEQAGYRATPAAETDEAKADQETEIFDEFLDEEDVEETE